MRKQFLSDWIERRGKMNQYRRIVSYLYQYLNGDKGQNIGYVRLEQKGRQCRVAVQMRAFETSFMPEVWLFKQEQTGISYVSIGRLSAYSGNMQIKVATNTDDVCSSGHPASDFDGAVIYINDKEYYATTWSKESIYIGRKTDMLKAGRHNSEEETRSNVVKEEAKEEEKDTTVKETAEIKEITVNISTENLYKDDNTEQDIRDVKEEMPKEKEEDVEDNIQDINAADTGVQETETSTADVSTQDIKEDMDDKALYGCSACPYKNYDKKNEDFGVRILKNFPVMYPFKSGEIEESVRIEPKDIGCMPIRLWSFANNRFLLHGYYCYKHLIFARLQRGCYALGIPGIYSEQEKKKAASFSFDEFQPIGPGKAVYGVFGYWITEIHV